MWRTTMSIDLIHDVWSELRNYIDRAEREDAASVMIDLLFDHDYSSDELVAAFKSDPDVIEVLQKSHPDIELDIEDSDDEFFYGDE